MRDNSLIWAYHARKLRLGVLLTGIGGAIAFIAALLPIGNAAL